MNNISIHLESYLYTESKYSPSLQPILVFTNT